MGGVEVLAVKPRPRAVCGPAIERWAGRAAQGQAVALAGARTDRPGSSRRTVRPVGAVPSLEACARPRAVEPLNREATLVLSASASEYAIIIIATIEETWSPPRMVSAS
jgi:hypothetical protein